jgi:hypothetical protein
LGHQEVCSHLEHCDRRREYNLIRRQVFYSNFGQISVVQAVGGLGGGIKAYVAANQVHDELRTILVYASLPYCASHPINNIQILDVAHR